MKPDPVQETKKFELTVPEALTTEDIIVRLNLQEAMKWAPAALGNARQAQNYKGMPTYKVNLNSVMGTDTINCLSDVVFATVKTHIPQAKIVPPILPPILRIAKNKTLRVAIPEADQGKFSWLQALATGKNSAPAASTEEPVQMQEANRHSITVKPRSNSWGADREPASLSNDTSLKQRF